MIPTLHHIDSASWICDDHAAIRITGWCAWRDDRPMQAFHVRSARGLDRTSEPTARDDVADHLGRVSARRSGFCFLLPLLEVADVLTLVAIDDHGRESTFFSTRVGDLPGRSAVILDYAQLRARGWLAAVEEPRRCIAPAAITDSGALLFSVLLPVHNTPEALLRECLESVRAQTCSRWELCIVDDASADAATRDVLEEFTRRDSRIRWEHLTVRSGIARATNRALEFARGEFILLLDHDDRLLPNALQEFAASIAAHSCDVIYSDEEKISESGEPCRPILKPAFSPEFFRGVMYVGHALCVRRTIAVAVGGFDARFDGIQDYEFVLRVSEKTRRIIHIPSILYQWRMVATSSALHGNVKGDIDGLHVCAVQAHLTRIGRAAEAHALGSHRVALLPPKPFNRPPLTIFATAAAAESPALRGLENVELIITPDGSRAMAAIREINTSAADRFVAYFGLPIIEASAGWLDHLAFLALEAECGRVSPILRSVDGRIVEAGRTFDSDGVEHAIMTGFDPATDGYNGSLRCHREVAAVSPVCWLARICSTTNAAGFDRICATAWIRTTMPPQLETPHHTAFRSAVDGGPSDPFFNFHFDPIRADYRLAHEPTGSGNVIAS